jgi:hypothetical protein
MFFAAESDPFQSEASHIINRRLPQVTYPALLRMNGEEISAIGRNDLQVVGGLPVYALRMRELVPAPDGSWIAYDQSSGQVVRMKLIEVD